MLIDNYELELFAPPCEPGSEIWTGIAHLPTDISEVLPYLNATLRGAIYYQAAGTLTWKKGGRNIAFHPNEIDAANLADRAQAEKVVKGLIKLVNSTWQKRDQIEPSHKQRRRPTPMAVYKLLPGTNCGECGEATCFNFALKLAAGQVSPESCVPMVEPSYAAQRADLQAMVGEMPAIGP